MALKFRKRVRIAPGVRINLSKSGVSTTIGVRGASVNVGKQGAYLNTGIPGTGIYDRTRIGGGKTAKEAAPEDEPKRTSSKSDNFFMVVGLVAIIAFVVWLVS